MYNPEGKIVRSVQEIREGLLSNPANAHRQEELSLLIDWLIARERHNNRSGIAALRAFEEKMGNEQSTALRALSLLEQEMGNDVAYKTAKNSITEFVRIIVNQPKEDQILVDLERLDHVQQSPILKILPVANAIKFDGLSGLFMPVAQEVPQTADEFIEQQSLSLGNKNPAPRFH